MAEHYHVPGVTAFARGVGVSALVLVLALLFAYGPSATAGVTVLAEFGGGDVADGVSLLGLVVMLALVVSLCLPLYLSLHGVEVSVAVGGGESYLAPGALLPPASAGLLVALPGLLLVWAGYSRARRREAADVAEHVVAGAAATVGYALVAVLAVVPGALLFDAGVNALLSAATPGGIDAVHLVYPNPVRSHLLVGLAYPLTFTALGGLLAGVLADDGDRHDAGGCGRREE